MAIKKKTDIGNQGISGEHWAPCDLQVHVGEEAGTTKVVVRYAMWLNAQTHADGKAPMRRGRRFTVVVPSTDPTLSDIERVCDKALLVKTVEAEPGERAIAGKPAIKAKAAVDADLENGIEAQPAQKAKAAVKAVKAKRPVQGVRGGELEGGSLVLTVTPRGGSTA